MCHNRGVGEKALNRVVFLGVAFAEIPFWNQIFEGQAIWSSIRPKIRSGGLGFHGLLEGRTKPPVSVMGYRLQLSRHNKISGRMGGPPPAKYVLCLTRLKGAGEKRGKQRLAVIYHPPLLPCFCILQTQLQSGM